MNLCSFGNQHTVDEVRQACTKLWSSIQIDIGSPWDNPMNFFCRWWIHTCVYWHADASPLFPPHESRAELHDAIHNNNKLTSCSDLGSNSYDEIVRKLCIQPMLVQLLSALSFCNFCKLRQTRTTDTHLTFTPPVRAALQIDTGLDQQRVGQRTKRIGCDGCDV